MPVSWFDHGQLSTFQLDNSTGWGWRLQPDTLTGALNDPSGSGGFANAEFPTRSGVVTTQPPAVNLHMNARAFFRMTGSTLPSDYGSGYEAAARNANWRRWACLVIVEASTIKNQPSRDDIYNAPSAKFYRAIQEVNTVAPGGPHDLMQYDLRGPKSSELKRNTKYWALVLPTWSKTGNKASGSGTPGFWSGYGAPSRSNDRLLAASTEYVASRSGRCNSFWTDRTPAKPTIVDPMDGEFLTPGEVVRVKLNVEDPDKGAVSKSSLHAMGVNGVQYQMAPKPPTGEQPEWRDISLGSAQGTFPAWGILGSYYGDPGTGFYPGPPLSTSTNILTAYWRHAWVADTLIPDAGVTPSFPREAGYGLPMRVGEAVDPNSIELQPAGGAIPAGEWLFRARVFQSGSPYGIVGMNPVSAGSFDHRWKGFLPQNGSPARWTPDNYPAVDMSPWSDPVRVVVPARVPPPILDSPVRHEAVVLEVGSGYHVFRWIYRNTSVAPEDRPQSWAEIQIRRRGVTDWDNAITLSTSSVEPQILVDQTLLGIGPWEWRARVRDSGPVDSGTSDWSFPETFWVVATPSQGGAPLPSGDPLNAATLGCGTHRVFLARRGGTVMLGEITQVSLVRWERVRDDISTASVVVNGWSEDCGALLAGLQPWAHELVIFRDNGVSVDRVWEGPVTLIKYERDAVTIDAKDVMAFAYRRIIKQRMSDGGAGSQGKTVVDRAVRVLQNTLGPDDPNVLANVVPLDAVNSAKQKRTTLPYTRTAYEEIDDMASNAGLDYTVVGRAIILWGTKSEVGRLPEMTDETLGSTPVVSVYGMELANMVTVTDGQSVWGSSVIGPRADSVEDVDPFFGHVEVLSTSWTDDDAADTVYTADDIARLKETYTGYAERALASKYPAPEAVRIPGGSSLSPAAPISIQHLVPGVVIPVRSVGTLRPVSSTMKLDSVKVEESSGSESISISASPFGSNDATPTPEEGA